jgi:hypothetical protein
MGWQEMSPAWPCRWRLPLSMWRRCLLLLLLLRLLRLLRLLLLGVLLGLLLLRLLLRRLLRRVRKLARHGMRVVSVHEVVKGGKGWAIV